ncbi:hypothetical protein ACFL59_09385, partial [Planctomycetota bacterium]
MDRPSEKTGEARDARELIERAEALLSPDEASPEELLATGLAAFRLPGAAGTDLAVRRVPTRVLDALATCGGLDGLTEYLERELVHLRRRVDRIRYGERRRRPEQEAGDAGDRAGNELREEAAALSRLLAEARWLRDVAGLAAGRSVAHRVRDHLRTLGWIDRETQRLVALKDGSSADSLTDLASAALLTRATAVRIELLLYMALLESLTESAEVTLEACFQALREAPGHMANAHAALRGCACDPDVRLGEDEQQLLHVDGCPSLATETLDLEACLEDVDTHRRALGEVVRSRLSALSPEERHGLLEQWTAEISEEARNALGSAEVGSLVAGAAALKLEHETAEWLKTLIVETDPNARRRLGGHSSLKAVYQKATRASRTLLCELLDKRHRLRLERTFGRAIVDGAEAVVLSLIVVITLLLGLELAFSDQLGETGRRLISWIDLGVCTVFLTEFAIRLAFAERKLHFVRRNFLIDLLPSIPYGFLASQLELLDLARVARVVRLARLARPVFLSLRGLDHLVARARPVLDRDVLVFAPPRTAENVQQPLESRFAELAESLERARRNAVLAAPDSQRVAALG